MSLCIIDPSVYACLFSIFVFPSWLSQFGDTWYWIELSPTSISTLALGYHWIWTDLDVDIHHIYIQQRWILLDKKNQNIIHLLVNASNTLLLLPQMILCPFYLYCVSANVFLCHSSLLAMFFLWQFSYFQCVCYLLVLTISPPSLAVNSAMKCKHTHSSVAGFCKAVNGTIDLFGHFV